MNTCTCYEPQGADTEAVATAQSSPGPGTQNTIRYTSHITCTAGSLHVNEEYR